jgi:hypothetical protein
MIRRPIRRSDLIALATAGVLMVSACGKQGKLDQPAPLFGAEAKAAYAAKKQAEADAAAKADEAKVVTPQPVTPQEIEAAPAATPN